MAFGPYIDRPLKDTLVAPERLSAIAALRDAFIAGETIDETLIRPEVLAIWKAAKSSSHAIDPDTPEIPGPRPLGEEAFPEELADVFRMHAEVNRTIFQYEIPVLERFHAACCLVARIEGSLTVIDALGFEGTVNDLAQKGIGLGTNFDSSLIGPNIVSEADSRNLLNWFAGPECYHATFADYVVFPSFFKAGIGDLSVWHIGYGQLYIVPIDDMSPEVFEVIELAVGDTRMLLEQTSIPQIRIRDAAFDQFLNRNDIAIMVLDGNDRVVDTNNRLKGILGLSFTEASGRDCREVVPELEPCLDSPRNSRKHGVVTAIVPRTNRDTLFEYDPLIGDGTYLGAIVYVSDAGKLKQRTKSVVDQKAHVAFDNIVGRDPAFLKVKETAIKAARSKSAILLCGEYGTGKELFARAIHNASSRRNKPFIAVDARGLYADTANSILFGNVEKFFADDQEAESIGKIEQASGGTLFLNNIQELPLNTQSILLDVLRTGKVTRIGSNIARPVDVRIVTSALPGLYNNVEAGTFRHDLYFMVNIVRIDMVPLRERADDIPLLVSLFAQAYNKAFNKRVTSVTRDALRHMKEYTWPGNITELRNVIERCIDLEAGTKITCEHMPEEILRANKMRPVSHASAHSFLEDRIPPRPEVPKGKQSQSFEEAESNRIRELMLKYNGNKSKVARELGMSRNTLYTRLAKIGEWD